MSLIRFVIIAVVILFLSAAVSIAFVYESQTLWYKIGTDKVLLRAGQIAGLLGAVLLIFQVMLGGRGKLLEQAFGVASVVRYHRINGILIGICLIVHVLLVLVPEGIANLPIGLKYWPELVGALLFWVVFSMVISSQFREKFGLDYKRWRGIHRLLGYSVPVLLGVHVYFVSDSFGQTLPRNALFITLGGLYSWVLYHKIVRK